MSLDEKVSHPKIRRKSVNNFLDRLWRTISRFIAKFGHSQYGFIPTTYILPRDRRLLKENWKSNESYIMKPVASARGIGIKMVSKIDQIPKKRPVIIQNYIRNPLLINGLKWDLRIYVFVTSFSPLVAYIAGKLMKNCEFWWKLTNFLKSVIFISLKRRRSSPFFDREIFTFNSQSFRAFDELLN